MASTFIIHVHAGIGRDAQHDTAFFILQRGRFAQAARVNFGIGFVGFDFQRPAQVHVAQLHGVFVSIDPHRARGVSNVDRTLVALYPNVALNPSHFDIRLVTFQLYVDLPWNMNFQLDSGSKIVAFPAESAVPLRIFHFHAYAITLIPEIDLDVFHPPFAVSVITFKMLVYVDRYLVCVSGGDVNCSFIVVNVKRAA